MQSVLGANIQREYPEMGKHMLSLACGTPEPPQKLHAGTKFIINNLSSISEAQASILLNVSAPNVEGIKQILSTHAKPTLPL